VLSYRAPEAHNTPLLIAALVLSLALVFVTAKVYHLRARPAWSTSLVIYEFLLSTICLECSLIPCCANSAASRIGLSAPCWW